MRISDWSSDVCSSDLGIRFWKDIAPAAHESSARHRPAASGVYRSWFLTVTTPGKKEGRRHCCPRPSRCELIPRGDGSVRRLLVALHLLLHSITHRLTFGLGHGAVLIRSEEHTSELQSLMRISSAVFCLTKKIHKTNISTQVQQSHYN